MYHVGQLTAVISLNSINLSLYDVDILNTIFMYYLRVFQTFFFIILVCEAIGTAATPDLLCQPRVTMKMIVEKQMEWRLAGETEVLGENLPQRHYCPSQNPTWPDPGLNPGRRDGKPVTNRLSYGAAQFQTFPVLSSAPQGSVLVSSLFLKYTNDIAGTQDTSLTLFANNDTALLAKDCYSRSVMQKP
jgi:hypothetical protein